MTKASYCSLVECHAESRVYYSLSSFSHADSSLYSIYKQPDKLYKLNFHNRPSFSPIGFWEQSHGATDQPIGSLAVLHKSHLVSQLEASLPSRSSKPKPTNWHTSVRKANKKSLALRRPYISLTKLARPIHKPIALHRGNFTPPPQPSSPSTIQSASSLRASPSAISISSSHTPPPEPDSISINTSCSPSPSRSPSLEPMRRSPGPHYQISTDNRIVVLKSDGTGVYPHNPIAEAGEINEFYRVDSSDEVSKHWRQKLGLYFAREGLKRKRERKQNLKFLLLTLNH